MFRCRVMGHRPLFTTSGGVLSWECQRCGEGGSKRYSSAQDAARYAAAFNREDREDIGRRPLLSLLPLGLARRGQRNPQSGSSRRRGGENR